MCSLRRNTNNVFDLINVRHKFFTVTPPTKDRDPHFRRISDYEPGRGNASADVLLELFKVNRPHLHHLQFQVTGSHLLHVDLEGALRLALGAGARLHLLVLVLEEGSQHEAALVAVVLDHAELGQHAGAAAHHAAGPDQLVQVQLPDGRKRTVFGAPPLLCMCWGADLPERPDLLHQRQVGDAHVDFVSDAVVLRVHGENDLFGRFIKNLRRSRKSQNIPASVGGA